jgi:hypothetical protein
MSNQGFICPHPPRRPRAEECPRLTATAARHEVGLAGDAYVVDDGAPLVLGWVPRTGSYGGRESRLQCPACERWARVLYCAPIPGWSCGSCSGVIHRSQRRSGNRRGYPKPATYHLQRLEERQAKAVALLGIAWPPLPMFWNAADLMAAPTAARLSAARREALALYIVALEVERLAGLQPMVLRFCRFANEGEETERVLAMAEAAKRLAAATSWALRARGGRNLYPRRAFNSALNDHVHFAPTISSIEPEAENLSSGNLSHPR